MKTITALMVMILIMSITATLVSFIDLVYGEEISYTEIEEYDYTAYNWTFVCANGYSMNSHLQIFDTFPFYVSFIVLDPYANIVSESSTWGQNQSDLDMAVDSLLILNEAYRSC